MVPIEKIKTCMLRVLLTVQGRERPIVSVT